MAKLTASTRGALATSQFAIPGNRSYPIPDISHAHFALEMVDLHGTPAEKAQVHAAVARKYPAASAMHALKNQLGSK